MMGGGVFNLLHTFFGGTPMFCLLYAFARWATRTEPQMLRLVLNSARRFQCLFQGVNEYPQVLERLSAVGRGGRLVRSVG